MVDFVGHCIQDKKTMKTSEKINAYEKQVLIIKSHIRDWLKERGFRMNHLTPRAVNDAVIKLLEESIIRTKLSKMKTVCPKHI